MCDQKVNDQFSVHLSSNVDIIRHKLDYEIFELEWFYTLFSNVNS